MRTFRAETHKWRRNSSGSARVSEKEPVEGNRCPPFPTVERQEEEITHFPTGVAFRHQGVASPPFHRRLARPPSRLLARNPAKGRCVRRATPQPCRPGA